MALEGLNRQAGLHAAGVVIADKPLWEYVPVYKDDKSRHARLAVRQGRRGEGRAREVRLPGPEDPHRHRRRAHALVRQNHPERNDARRPTEIPLDDPAVYELIARGDTDGVFQMESSGFTDMVTKMKPSRFDDVIAAGALFRPGPLDQKLDDGRTMVDVYIDRKHGPREGPLPPPRARAHPRGDLRRHRLPGAGDADLAGPGRLQPGPRRPAPPRHGEEEGRGDGQGARRLPGRRAGEAASTRRSPAASST